MIAFALDIDAEMERCGYLAAIRAAKMKKRLPPEVRFEDLHADALVGLWRGIRTFDASRGTRPRSWYVRCIWSAMLDGLRERDRCRRTQRRRGQAPNVFSLNEPLDDDGHERGANLPAREQPEPLGDDADWLRVLRCLCPKQRAVLTMYYRQGMKLEEIGLLLGVSPSRASQLKLAAEKTLRETYRARELFVTK